MGHLYKLDFPSGKSYVGITVTSALDRFKGHRKSARDGSQAAVHRAWRKYGDPELSVLAVVENKMLQDAEKRAIAVFGTFGKGGYNLTPGGEVSPFHVPELFARAIANSIATRRSRPMSQKDRDARGAAMRGRQHTPESRAKMREAINRPEARIKMALARKKLIGQKRTPEQCEKMSAAHRRLQQTLPPPHERDNLKAMWAATRGKKFTAEHKAKIAMAMMGNRNREKFIALQQKRRTG